MKMETAKYDENRLLHLLLDMGEMLLASGAEINRVEDTLQRIGRAYGAAKMNVFVITSSIVITMERTDGELLTHTRRVNYTGSTDFTALEQLNALSRNCCINPIPLDQFQRRRAEGTMGSLYGKYPGSRQFCCVFWRDICRWSCGGTGGCPDLLYTAKSDEIFCKYDHV